MTMGMTIAIVILVAGAVGRCLTTILNLWRVWDGVGYYEHLVEQYQKSLDDAKLSRRRLSRRTRILASALSSLIVIGATVTGIVALWTVLP